MLGWYPEKDKYGAEHYTPPSKKSLLKGPLFVALLILAAALTAGIFLS